MSFRGQLMLNIYFPPQRSSELSESDAKTALDLLRLQRTVEAMKTGAEAGNKRPAQAKFFWDDVAPREKAEADQSAS